RLAQNHFLWRMPIGPFGLARHLSVSAPAETLAAGADAIAHSRPPFSNRVEKMLRRIDHDRSRRRFEIDPHQLAAKFGIELLEISPLNIKPAVRNSADIPLGRIDGLIRFDAIAYLRLDLHAVQRFLRASAGSGERRGGSGKEAAARKKEGH